MIKAIIFDCFGVLTNDAWKEFLDRLNPLLVEDIRSAHTAYDRGFIEYQDFRAQIMTLAGSDAKTIDTIFMHKQQKPKNRPLLEYIKTLKQQYKIGMLSNAGTAWVREDFLSPEEVALFDDMVLSFEVGLSKPDPDIFALACARLGSAFNETIFIDDLERYCQPARELGLRVVQYRNFEQCKKDLESLLADSDD